MSEQTEKSLAERVDRLERIVLALGGKATELDADERFAIEVSAETEIRDLAEEQHNFIRGLL